MQGLRYTSGAICSACLSRSCHHFGPIPFRIQPCHQRVILLAAEGLRNKQIAAAVNLDCATVKVYLNRVGRALKLRGRVALAQWVRDNEALFSDYTPASSGICFYRAPLVLPMRKLPENT